MYVVGLTGGIGSGKTTIANLFADHGVTLVDADLAARVVVEKGQPALQSIADHFGEDILQTDGSLDRSKLREIVFQQPEERGWLERLLHPMIFRELRQQLLMAKSPYAILVSPLLVETGQNRLTQRILVVDVPEDIQLQRTMERDTNSEEQVRAIMKAQASREKRLSYADDVILNDKPLENITQRVEELHKLYCHQAAASDT